MAGTEPPTSFFGKNYDSDFVKEISDYIIVFICGYATCAIIGRSGAN